MKPRVINFSLSLFARFHSSFHLLFFSPVSLVVFHKISETHIEVLYQNEGTNSFKVPKRDLRTFRFFIPLSTWPTQDLYKDIFFFLFENCEKCEVWFSVHVEYQTQRHSPILLLGRDFSLWKATFSLLISSSQRLSFSSFEFHQVILVCKNNTLYLDQENYHN